MRPGSTLPGSRPRALLLAPGRALSRWFLDPVPLYGMVIARWMLGTAIFLCYALRLPDVATLYATDSVAWFPPYRTYLGDVGRLPLDACVRWLAALPAAFLSPLIWTLVAVLLLASLCFAAGFRTRLAGSLTLLLHSLLVAINPLCYWGWSLLVQPYLLYVILAPTAATSSLDRRLRGNPPRLREAPAWPLRLLQIHVCTMYAEAGFSRIDHEGWRRGEMLLEALSNTQVTRLAIDWQSFAPALQVLCWIVFVLEPASSLLLWIRPLRPWITAAMLAMHVGLEVLTRVGMWNLVMAAGLFAFVPPSWLARFFPDEKAAHARDGTPAAAVESG